MSHISCLPSILYIRAVKWYIEFPLVIIILIATVLFVLTAQFPSCNKPTVATKANTDTTQHQSKASIEKERWMEGKSLFKSNCASCHNPKADGTGPALVGVTARWKAAGAYQGKTGEQWLHLWIRNWNDVVAANYKYGVDMANSRPAQMNVFVSLSDEQIDKILNYVEQPDLHVNDIVVN